MIRILANDGLETAAVETLRDKGYDVITDKVPQEELADYINRENVRALLVRSATKVRQPLIDACPNLSFIGRGGVGMDNIDVAYARSQGRVVTNTPAASSDSVAEMVFAHLFSLSRRLHHANRYMPSQGLTEFSNLKKKYADAFELRGKTIGIIGFGRIGQATAKMAIGLGMRVLPHDPWVERAEIELDLLHTGDSVSIEFPTVSLETLFAESDMISFHVPKPSNGKAVIGEAEMKLLKPGVLLVNTARGGIIDEAALLQALDSGQVGGAGLDVFENEPTPMPELLNHDKISVSPHVGGSTREAQERIGAEIASYLIAHFDQ
jgi:D-3-phosphoglycerate dehydrogenase / 2-oxoglutarate reductase